MSTTSMPVSTSSHEELSMSVQTSSPEEPFPVRRIDEIEPQDPDKLWLIEELWLLQGVGLLGAPPNTTT